MLRILVSGLESRPLLPTAEAMLCCCIPRALIQPDRCINNRTLGHKCRQDNVVLGKPPAYAAAATAVVVAAAAAAVVAAATQPKNIFLYWRIVKLYVSSPVHHLPKVTRRTEGYVP